MMLNSKKAVAELFARAEIELNGPNPWDPRIRDDRFYSQIIANGALGLGESCMDGDWDCAALDQFFDRVISKGLSGKVGLTISLALLRLQSRLLNRQSVSRAKVAADVHYDLPIDIFEATFDTR